MKDAVFFKVCIVEAKPVLYNIRSMNFGSQILIFYAVGFFALLNNSCKSDRTIALFFRIVNMSYM